MRTQFGRIAAARMASATFVAPGGIGRRAGVPQPQPVPGGRPRVGWRSGVLQPQPVPIGMRGYGADVDVPAAAAAGGGALVVGSVVVIAGTVGGAIIGYRLGKKHKILTCLGGALAGNLITGLLAGAGIMAATAAAA